VRSLCTSGEAIFYKVRGTVTGSVVELQHLPSKSVAVERDITGKKTYLYYFDPALPPRRLREDEIIFIKFDDALDKDRGLAPLAAAARETDVDNATAEIRRTFFENGAILQGILTTEQKMQERELKAQAAMWKSRYGGPKRAGGTPALGGGLSYQEVGAVPDKWAFKEVTGLSESRICSAFGVPPILVGAKIGLEHGTYSNYREARSACWEDSVTPLLVFLADEFSVGLTDIDDARECRWDTDEVPALQEDADTREERAGRSLARGATTLNEYREAAGLEPVPDGNVYFQPTNIKVVAEGEIGPAEIPAPLEEFTEPSGDDEEEEETPAVEEETPESPAVDERALRDVAQTNGHQAHGSGISTRRFIEIRESVSKLEGRLAKAIEEVFGKQADSVAEKVAQTLNANDLLDVVIEAERMAEAVEAFIRDILSQVGQEAAEDAESAGFGTGDFDEDDADVTDYIDSAPLLLGEEMVGHTRELIRQELEVMAEEEPLDNWELQDIRDRLRDIIVDRNRANLAAETETVRTSNRAAKLAYRQAGVGRIIWRNTSEEPCEFCSSLEGRSVSVDEAFASLGDELEGDDGGVFEVSYEDAETPPLHPRCNCFIEFVA
jgi:HK97 family phage portal protein